MTQVLTGAQKIALAPAQAAHEKLTAAYEHYMTCVETQIEAEAAARAAMEALRALPEYAAMDTADQAARAARQAADEALAEVKAAVVDAYQNTGERQPHPYARVLRIDRRPAYDPALALVWVKARRPDYDHLVIPEAVDRKGFEKLARALDTAGMPPRLDNGGVPVPVVEWDEIPVVRVVIAHEEGQ